MFKTKSVVFIVSLIIICSVFGKNHKLRSKLSNKPEDRKENKIEGRQEIRAEVRQDIKVDGQVNKDLKPEERKDQKPEERKDQKPEERKDQKPEERKDEKKEEKPEDKPVDDHFCGDDLIDQEVPPFDSEYERLSGLFLASFEEDVNSNPENIFARFVDEEFKAADKSADNLVSYEEYLERLGEVAKRFEIPEDIFSEEQLREVFDYFDQVEQDGNLNREEFANLVQASIGVLLHHFEFVEDNGLEDLFNLKEYLHEIRRILEEEDLYEFALELKYSHEADFEVEVEEEEHEEHHINEDDVRHFVEGLLEFVEAPEDKREEILASFQGGDEELDAEDLDSLVRPVLERIADEIENVISHIEEEIDGQVPEEFTEENTQAALLKMKSYKKSRKMKKNLKIAKKNKKVRSKKTMKMFMRK